MCLWNRILFFSALLSYAVFAHAKPPIYLAFDAGIFRGNFRNTFTDLTDVIKQNITEDSTQYGYTVGMAAGYIYSFNSQYSLGGELAGYLNSHDALYQAGASTSAFSDKIKIKNNIDFLFVPGLMLSNSVRSYLKLGVSVASIEDKLVSPAGFAATMTRYSSHRNAVGFASAIGVNKLLTEHVSIFTEAGYHDYGVVDFSNFQNFSADYSHSAHVYSYNILLGLAYQL